MKEIISSPIIGGVQLPKLKGRTTIILRDKNGSEKQRVVSENMVTNAVAKIFANNFANTLDVTDKRILPIKNLFGGVMCFQQTINESAGNIFPPDQGTNPLIAHAGDYASTTSANPKLGTLDAANSGEITNGYRWQWFFNLSQGVGKINCCCLTSAAGGNIGLTPTENIFPHMIIPATQNVPTGANSGYITIDNIIYTPIKYDRTTGKAYAVFASGSTFTEIEMEQRVLKFGLNTAPLRHSEDEVTVSDVVHNRYAWKEVRRRTVALSHGSVGEYHAIATDGTDYYVFQSSSSNTSSGSTTITGSKIATGGTDLVSTNISTISGGSFATLPCYESNGTHIRRGSGRNGFIPIRTEGNHKWAYFPHKDQNSFYKVDLNNVQDITLLTSRVPEGYIAKCWMPAYWMGKVCFGYNFIINNDSVYPAAIPEGIVSSFDGYTSDVIAFDDTPSLLLATKYSRTGDTSTMGYLKTGIASPYLATINNLESEVEKTLSQTMSIIYELLEVQ